VDVLPMMPYPERPAEPHEVEAVQREMGQNRETPARGLLELRAAVADYVGEEIGRGVDAETEVLISNGAMQALNFVFRSILNPGDEVIIPSPCYFFGGCVALAGGVPVYVAMDDAQGFAWDLARIEEAITSRSVAIVVNSPVNPAGVAGGLCGGDAGHGGCLRQGDGVGTAAQQSRGAGGGGGEHEPAAA
jgi:aspartate/methionine/tyrosine aminotransferase